MRLSLDSVWIPRTPRSSAIAPAERVIGFTVRGGQRVVGIAAWQEVARDAEERAVAGVANASTADFTDDLCSPTLCAAQRGTVWLYRDSAHRSVDGSLSLTNRFAELIGVHPT